jgi:glycosyltransferase involved in cell wall biosynthesis
MFCIVVSSVVFDSKVLNLIYFGRIVEEKSIDFIIDICEMLKTLNIDFKLNLFGGYKLQYYEFLQSKIITKNLNNAVQFHGRKDFEEIKSYLNTSHFFIFPSKEKNEGHSNSLTEAMAFGVVPIVSNVGFNKKVVNDDDLVIQNFDSLIYAERIIDIWSNLKWQEKSNQNYIRVMENYTENNVTKTLFDLYLNL